MSDKEIELMDRIVIHPDICHGKPRIKGTRIIISIILDWLAEGASFEEIIDAYPSLAPEDIKTILNYSRKLVKNHSKVSNCLIKTDEIKEPTSSPAVQSAKEINPKS